MLSVFNTELEAALIHLGVVHTVIYNEILYIHVQIFKILNKGHKMYIELSLDCR